jgi:hypothetical protein
MGNRRNPHDNKIDDKERYHIENAHRIDQLMDLVERHTRTKRHLEQHSDITNLNELQHAFKIQEEREKRIDHLKDIIVYGKHEVNDMSNLQRNFKYTNNYLKHHEAHMDETTLENTREKQEHRKEQMEFMHQNNIY